jgi:predicted DNA-binding protein with PD1-like motif
MHHKILAIAVLSLGTTAAGQETRTEIVKPTTPADDAKANSDLVPDVYAVSARFDRVVVLRFKHETDLLAGIEKMIRQEKIQNAVVLSGIGSVKSYSVHQVSNRTFPSKNVIVTNPTGAADLIGMNGYIIDGKVHAHMTLAIPERAFGGHLEPGTQVFTFAIVTLGVLEGGADLRRMDDKTFR